jgi:ferric iron reductase protein FhuF
VVLDLDATTLWWRDVLGAVPLALPEPRGRPVDADVVAALAAGLADGPVAALTEVMAANGVSRKVLWGNVASAVAGARSALVAAAPDRASSILATVQALFDVEPLVGTGAFGGGMQPREFRRNSCCLYYRVPGGGYCGDCVLPGR